MSTTLYQEATRLMNIEIGRYLDLAQQTQGFTRITEGNLEDEHIARLFAAGIGITDPTYPTTPEILVRESLRRSAVPFDAEQAVTIGVYLLLRPFAAHLFNIANELTDNFTRFDADVLHQNPHILPVLQHVAGIFSKAILAKEIGSVSDSGISKPAAERLAALLSSRVVPSAVVKDQILRRLESTSEGIVRDLVGRVLLEDIVATALVEAGVPFLREADYSKLSGVVYDFRADFVIPNEVEPVAFIEVWKSSSRHASLYAKDKMFSAINWKGRHKGLIGVVIVAGDWTRETLATMAKLFDYVIPLHKSTELAKILKRAVEGDASVQKWLIEFQISAANPKNS